MKKEKLKRKLSKTRKKLARAEAELKDLKAVREAPPEVKLMAAQ